MKIVTKVETVKNAPSFTVNGEPFTVPIMETYCPEEFYFRQFSAAGCKVFSFNTNAGRCDYGHSEPIQPEKGRFDFTQFDERMDNIVRHNKNALVMPRVMCGTPDWWLDENPYELMIMSDGKTLFDSKSDFLNTYPTGRPFPTLASEKWRAFISDGLKNLIAHIEEKYPDNFFGIFLSGMHTEEWYHWNCNTAARADYSPHMRDAFREWLKEKYGTEAALKKSWNMDVDFDTAEIPTQEERESKPQTVFRNIEKQMNTVDFYCFFNEMIPMTIDCLAKAAKSHMTDQKVVGAFYAYMYEFFGDPEFGHNALGTYNESENLDFVFVTASYDGRKRGTGSDYLRAPAYSTRLHKKLWYHDNDVASFLTPDIMSPERGFTKEQTAFYCDKLGVTENPAQTADMYRRSAGFALCNGLFESYFDLHGGYFNHSDLLFEVSNLNRMFERSAAFDRASNAEILIVADEESNAYASFKSKLVSAVLHDNQVELTKIGAGCDHILSRDVGLLDEAHLDRYKLVIFLNCYSLDDERRGQIGKKLRKNGRTLFFCYAQGLYNGNMKSDENMEEFTGIRLKYSGEAVSGKIICGVRDSLTDTLPEDVSDIYLEEIFADDGEAVCLGNNENGNCVFARKDCGEWVSYYCQSPLLTGEFVRELAKRAGVHIFNDSSDVLYANASYLTVHAASDGKRTLSFKTPVNIYDAMTETTLEKNCTEYSFDTEFGKTEIFRYEATE